MTQLEYFKAWAKERYPGMDQTTDAKALEDGTVLFFHDTLQVAWRAFQYRYTIRPTTTMANGTLNAEEFRKDDPATIVDRLRGIYEVPIKGQYKTEPILHEAAREIERLREMIASARKPEVKKWWVHMREYDQHDIFACKVCKKEIRVDVMGVPLPEECPSCNG